MLINFPYIQRDTPIHRLDPRVKWILVLVYSFTAAQTSNLWLILAGLFTAAFFYSKAQLKWSETRRVWIVVIILNSMIVFLNYFLSGGAIVQGIDLSNQHILFSLPFIGLKSTAPFIGPSPLIFSVESITFMLTMGMRNFGLAFLAITIPYTTDPALTGITFKGMRLPDRFSYAIDLSFRFLPTVGRDFATTLDAQRARGFEVDKLRGGLFSKIARLAPMIIPVVIGSIVGAEDIINAMELRCFGVGKRTWLRELHARRIDRLFIILSFAVLAIITLFNILGFIYLDGPLHILHTQGIPDFLIP